jgi:hypothetical protein
MKTKNQILFILLLCVACVSEPENEMTFDKTKWAEKEGEDYPYRNLMLSNVIYNDTIRNLNKNDVLNLLGEPDRINEGYIYYMINQKRLVFWPLHSKFLVFKFKDKNTIDWIKIHE